MGGTSVNRLRGAAGLVAVSLLWAAPGWCGDTDTEKAALAAKERVVVAGVALALDTEIWAEGPALAATGAVPATVMLRITAPGTAVPVDLRMDGLWYVNGRVVSEGALQAEPVSAPEGEVMGQASGIVDPDGDGLVDVVIGVRDAGGRIYLLKAPAQPLRGL